MPSWQKPTVFCPLVDISLQTAYIYSQAPTTFSASENIKAAPTDPTDPPILSDEARKELVSRAAFQIKSDFVFSKRWLGRVPSPLLQNRKCLDGTYYLSILHKHTLCVLVASFYNVDK